MWDGAASSKSEQAVSGQTGRLEQQSMNWSNLLALTEERIGAGSWESASHPVDCAVRRILRCAAKVEVCPGTLTVGVGE